MNFLAHVFLSGPNEQIMVGNFMGDFIKGKNALEKFEPDIVRGVELHRLIDDFTDRHPVVAESKNRLRPKYRHYAGVVVDVFYDHFLASGWSRFHPIPLEDFASHVYQTVGRFDKILPEGVRYMLPHMQRGNWLVNYSRIEGIHRALSGMSRRTSFVSHMEEASEDLRLYFEDFKREFELFFPALQNTCHAKLLEWNQARV